MLSNITFLMILRFLNGRRKHHVKTAVYSINICGFIVKIVYCVYDLYDFLRSAAV